MARTAILAITHLRAGNAEQALKAIQDCWRLQGMTEDNLEKSRIPNTWVTSSCSHAFVICKVIKSQPFELASKSNTMRKDMFRATAPRVANSIYLIANMLAEGGKVASAIEFLRHIIEMSQGLIEMRGHHARDLWTLARSEAGTATLDEIQRFQQMAREATRWTLMKTLQSS